MLSSNPEWPLDLDKTVEENGIVNGMQLTSKCIVEILLIVQRIEKVSAEQEGSHVSIMLDCSQVETKQPEEGKLVEELPPDVSQIDNELTEDKMDVTTQIRSVQPQSSIVCFGVQFNDTIRMISIPDCMIIKDLILLLNRVFSTCDSYHLYRDNVILNNEASLYDNGDLNGCVLVFKV